MSESRLQSEVVKYIQLQYPKARYCASLGGQYQPFQSQRNRARKTGYVKGFPDLFIYESRTVNHQSMDQAKELYKDYKNEKD